MRTIILSFSYKWYKPLIQGLKIYEHRKRFCNEPVMAYIYLGIPYRQLVAVAELDLREDMTKWIDKYSQDEAAVARINDFLSRNRYAMKVLSIQEIEPIDMREAEKEIDGFRVPISYTFLDNNPALFDYIRERTRYKGVKIINSFENITSDDICRY